MLGVPVHDVTAEETLVLIDRFVREKTPHQICTVNPEFIMAAQQDAEFRRILNYSALNLPDGIGVVWAARRLGHPLRERVADPQRLLAVAGDRVADLLVDPAQELRGDQAERLVGPRHVGAQARHVLQPAGGREAGSN